MGRCALTYLSPLLMKECPEQRWPKETEPPLRLLWISGDMAQGGCTRYCRDILKIMRDMPLEVHVVWFNDHHFWPFIESELKAVAASVTQYDPATFPRLVSEADVITSMNFNHHIPDHDKVIDLISGKLFCQVHGTCFYAKGIVDQHRRATKFWLACSGRAAKLCADTDDDVLVSPVPIDFGRLVRQQPKAAAKAEIGLPPETRVVTYAGRLAEEKGLVRCAETLAELPSDIKFMCVGDGYHGHIVIPKMQEILGDRLILRRWVDHPTDYLDCSDAFLLMSDWEGVPLVLVEALSYGLPVISVDVGVAKDYLICPLGKMPYSPVWAYQSPATILKALAFNDEPQRREIIEHMHLSHSEKHIRQLWWKWLTKLKAVFKVGYKP